MILMSCYTQYALLGWEDCYRCKNIPSPKTYCTQCNAWKSVLMEGQLHKVTKNW